MLHFWGKTDTDRRAPKEREWEWERAGRQREQVCKCACVGESFGSLFACEIDFSIYKKKSKYIRLVHIFLFFFWSFYFCCRQLAAKHNLCFIYDCRILVFYSIPVAIFGWPPLFFAPKRNLFDLSHLTTWAHLAHRGKAQTQIHYTP